MIHVFMYERKNVWICIVICTSSVLKYKMFWSIIIMHISRHLLVCRLEANRVNLYTIKLLDTYMSMIG
jgi:hypothetical protein